MWCNFGHVTVKNKIDPARPSYSTESKFDILQPATPQEPLQGYLTYKKTHPSRTLQ